jgi:hypothetical protein
MKSRSDLPAWPSAISSCRLRRLPGVPDHALDAATGPRARQVARASWRSVAALDQSEWANFGGRAGGPSSGPSTHRQPAIRASTLGVRRDSGHGTRWHQAADVSPGRTPHTALNADAAGHNPAHRRRRARHAGRSSRCAHPEPGVRPSAARATSPPVRPSDSTPNHASVRWADSPSGPWAARPAATSPSCSTTTSTP